MNEKIEHLVIRRLIVLAVMSATLMQVLDTTIVNVALPHMSGSLGTTNDEISWVLTSYLIASAVFMPLTGYFTDLWGRKKYLLVSIAGFIVASALCGAAENIMQLVSFRLLQGVFGAALVPLSQAIMVDIYPENERGKAMALWGIGVMVGPILGPTLGGYLTEVANWRWNFYINIPVGFFSLFLAWWFVPDTQRKSRSMDWLGISLIFITIGSLQYILDRGNRDDWFDSKGICLAGILVIVGSLCFCLHYMSKRDNIVADLSVFKDRNFAVASLLMGMFGLGFYGAMVILPLMLENLFNYPVMTTGLMMAPRGISSMISIILVGKIIQHVDSRQLIGVGILISGIGVWLGTFYNLNTSPGWIIGPIVIQGFGLGMIFTPLSTIAFSTIPSSIRSEAAGLFSLLRTIGSSMGISVVETLLTRDNQRLWNELGGFIHPYNSALMVYLNPLNLEPTSPLAAEILKNELLNQVQMISFVNIYAFIAWSFLCMLPLLFLLKRQSNSQNDAIVPVD